MGVVERDFKGFMKGEKNKRNLNLERKSGQSVKNRGLLGLPGLICKVSGVPDRTQNQQKTMETH
jgi:hypothetical protein